MTKEFCDICGKEISDWTDASDFKLKKRIYSWRESLWRWERMTVHKKCWMDLCEKIRKENN